MSAETQSYQHVPEPILQSNQIEVFTPRNERGERIGVGAILETRTMKSGKENESILRIALRSLFRYGRETQEPQGAKEQQALRTVRRQLAQQETRHVQQWAENHEGGHRYYTDEEREVFAAKKQQLAAQQP